MAERWFFDDELVTLRLEWVRLMREYHRSRVPSVLDAAHEAHACYVQRADRLRRGDRSVTGTAS